MFCSHCGTKIDGGHVFCPNCGEKLPLEKEKTSTPLWLKALFALPFIALITLFIYYYNDNPPVSSVEDQLEALHDHKLTEAYYGYTTTSFQEATSLEKFKEKVKSAPVLTKIKKVEVIEEKVSDDLSELKVLATTDEGQTVTIEYQLSLVDGIWKILYFKLIDNNIPATL